MRIAMPSMRESLTYSVVAAIALTALAALVIAVAGGGNLVGAITVLAVAAGIYWLVARNPATIVTAREVAATVALLLLLCALANLATGYPYQAVLFLLAAAALGFAFLLLQQGTMPVELWLGGVLAVSSSHALVQLRMLEELRDAGILSTDEFAAKRLLIES